MAPQPTSADELLRRATERVPLTPADAKTGSSLERLVIDGQRYVVKRVHVDDDWAMRGLGDLRPLPLLVHEHGLFDVVSDRIDHAIVAASPWGRNGWGAALVMRDVSSSLVPEGDDPIPEEQHLGFLDALAVLAARTWGWHDQVGLLPYEDRWSFFLDCWLDVERARGWPNPVPRIAADGWARFDERAAPETRDLVQGLRHEPWVLPGALRATPSCFLHGDWKLGNLGTHTDGRVVLLDCAFPGQGPVCHELAWYLALNRARLPAGHTKERVITDFRDGLVRHGVAVDDWWDRQLGLCLLGALVQFGWEKALGSEDELAWWCDAALEGARFL